MSNNLGLSQIAATQSNKHVTANDQAGELDAAITEVLSVPVDDSNAATVSDSDFRRHFFFDIEENCGFLIEATGMCSRTTAPSRS